MKMVTGGKIKSWMDSGPFHEHMWFLDINS
jgi:hypothetical protein